jgi:kynureninase
LTGHSHQAWPDCGFEGQKEAWLDAAQNVDNTWDRAFAKADEVRRGYARLLNDSSGDIALAQNTHDLVVKFLSALPLSQRPRIVTTDGEFHSIRRQVDRLAEENLEIFKVSATPAATLAARLAEAVDDRTATVMLSSVMFRNAQIIPGLGGVMEACAKVGAELLVDAYHSLNVVPFSVESEGLASAYIVGAGYKYCQLGEGNGFLRTPKNSKLRPIITGWFAEFDALTAQRNGERVAYGSGASRFAGATYDPTSHYRAAEVFRFFDEQRLTPSLLRQVSQHQIGLLAELFDELDADPQLITRDRSTRLDNIGGFLVLESPHAPAIRSELETRGVFADHRDQALRLGPAPYLCDDQLKGAMDVLGEVIRSLG